MGKRWYALNSLLQFTQWEEGKTTDSPLGIRHMHTFKKEPIMIPKINISIFKPKHIL